MGSTSIILKYLKDLSANNNREWFQANKERYDEANILFRETIQSIIEKTSKFDPEIGLLSAKDCVFRIYRDVRFSKDKTPYKQNFGASIKVGGRKSPFAGYYLHIQPGNSIIAGGVYHTSPENLARIRQEIDYNPKPIKKVLAGRKFKDAFGEIKGDKLKRPPKGYEADHEDIELLKHKDFIVYHSIKDATIRQPGFDKEVARTFKVMKPFLDYFNVAIGG